MNSRRPNALALLLPIVLSAACAATAERSDDAQPETADAAVVATPNASPSAEADAAPADAAPADAASTSPRLTGAVYLSQWNDDANPEAPPSIVGLEMWETRQDPVAAGCTTTTVEGCEVRRCAPYVEANGHVATPREDRGEITVDGVDPGRLSFSDPAGLGAASARLLWRGGETIAVHGTAPAFHVELAAPPRIEVTSAPADGARLARGAGFDVGWAPAEGTVRVWVNQTGPDASTVRLRCDAPARAGRATVPGAALAAAPVGSSAHVYVVSLATARTVSDELDLTVDLKFIAREFDLDVR